MKNILIINQYGSTPTTGFGGRTYYLAQSLARSNKVTVVYGSFHHLLRSDDHQISDVNCNHGDTFSINTLKLLRYSSSRSILRIINWFIFSFKLCFLSRKNIGFQPTCIIYSSPALPGYLGAYILSRRFSCPLFIEVRDIWPLSIVALGRFSKNNVLVILLREIEKFAYRTADGVISNLYNLQNHISKSTGKITRFHFSPNGVVKNNSLINKMSQGSEALGSILCELRKLQSAGKTIVGYVGGLAPANAMDLLIDTALLANDDSDLFFVIVGDGPERKRLEARCAGLSLQNIQFYPGVLKREVPLLLDAMHILFLANQFKEIYSFGVSPIKLPEYLESKKPIVHVTNSRSLLDEFQCWEVVREYEPSAVIRSVYTLKNLPDSEKLQIGERVHKYTCMTLNYDSIGDSLISFLEDVNS